MIMALTLNLKMKPSSLFFNFKSLDLFPIRILMILLAMSSDIFPVARCDSLASGSLPEYCELWNAALCKPTDIESVDGTGTAGKAVDGSRSGKSVNCANTKKRQPTWWLVDLEDEYLIRSVRITNRLGYYAFRMEDAEVILYTSDPRLLPDFPTNSSINGTSCTYVTEDFKYTKTFDCTEPTYGRWVMLIKDVHQVLHLCEMEVMVSQKRGDPNPCARTVTKEYSINKNSILPSGKGVVTETIFLSNALFCVELCRKRENLCNGCYWQRETGRCQLLTFDAFAIEYFVLEMGTDIYVETLASCYVFED